MIHLDLILSNATIGAKGGFVAGLAMAAVMELGEKSGWFRVNLPKVDGYYFMADRFGPSTTYLIGLAIHSVTSIGLGIACLVGTALAPLVLSPAFLDRLAAYSWGLAWALVLWVVFGLTVSPVTGLGLFGQRKGRWVWLELMATHIVYGLTLAWMSFGPR